MTQRMISVNWSEIDDDLKKNPNLTTLFLDCVDKMETEQCLKEIRGSQILLEPGQLATTYGDLGYISRLSRNQVRYGLLQLEKQGLIRIETMGQYTVITIPDWEKYVPEYDLP